MKNYLFPAPHDLVSPDGYITHINPLSPRTSAVQLLIQGISPAFIGFHIDKKDLCFNLKSTLAQLGLDATLQEFELDVTERTARVRLELTAYGHIAQALLHQIPNKAYIGKLFAADPRRRVRDPDYLMRMFGRTDRQGSPLLSLGGPKGRDELLLEKIEGRTVAFLRLQEGILSYDEQAILGLLPTVHKALLHADFRLRTLIQLDQIWKSNVKRITREQDILLVRTAPLHIRTAFGKVVGSLLPQGVHHTRADVLEPDTNASGDVYELYGETGIEVQVIPIEFYTLEPHREHVFFADRDQLQTCLEDPRALFNAFQTMPSSGRASTFVVKGEQLLHLEPDDWIAHNTCKSEFPGLFYPTQQSFLVQRYIEQQTEYPFLKSIEEGLISSQGILLTRYFPSPLMKRLLLSSLVQRCLKGIYFHRPSFSWGDFFSHEDRSLLLDLSKFGIPVYWVDEGLGRVLQYVPKPGKDAGMFVPLPLIDTFVKATAFGIYGSTLIQGDFEEQLTQLLRGIVAMRPDCKHPLLNPETPIALVTGGGPGLMEVGNRVAERIGILSCANIVDFRNSDNLNIQEQHQNPYISAKMTYRLDKLVERQSEFNLDFPIILTGGYGTDFEQCLEEVRRKVGSMRPTPVLLFGEPSYWRAKITTRFQCNHHTKTIAGSEWVSNCFYCVQTAEQGLKIYKQFFSHTLPIGPQYPGHTEGFTSVH